MLNYSIDWNHFNGKFETNIAFYNLNNNITINVILYRTPNKLEIDFKVIQSNNNNGYNVNTLETGTKYIGITYNQFQKPTKKVYLAKIEKALIEILTKYFTIEEVEQTENDTQNEEKEIIKNNNTDSIVNTEEKTIIQLSPIQKIQNNIFNREHKEAIEYFLNKYSHLQIGDIIHIKTQKELDHLEYMEYDEVINIFEDTQDNNKVKAIIKQNIIDYYNKNPIGYVP